MTFLDFETSIKAGQTVIKLLFLKNSVIIILTNKMFTNFFDSITYVFLFTTFYLQVFLMLTYLEERKYILKKEYKDSLDYYPSTTYIVPCWNEEKTVQMTVDSLLDLNYPKDKLKIIVVDDGSKDRTWEIMQMYKDNPQVILMKKENGGKHTALNEAIKISNTELIGCLDADSKIEKNSLIAIADAFNKDPILMAVNPVQIIWNRHNFIQKMQMIEFQFNAFLRRIFSRMDSTITNPGPGTLFRKEVFDKIGLFEDGHRTEDCEFTLRMQKNHMRIRNVHTSYVYTSSMPTIKTLYKQRVRWTYGTIRNMLDYRFMFFKKQYGTFGMVILPFYFFLGYIFLFNVSYGLFTLLKGIYNYSIKASYAGFNLHIPSFDLFYFNTNFMGIMFYLSLGTFFFMVWKGTKISNNEQPSLYVFYYILYGFLAPIWLTKSIVSIIRSKTVNWR